jgi:glutamate N-acetyltransferase/amino-acid N-acetyltransferase
MTLSLIALEKPTSSFAAVFTRNAFPGAPVIVGRERLREENLGALIINNKISNVCAPDGVASCERVCSEVGRLLGIPASAVFPGSTGVIGWKLPVAMMVMALPRAVQSLQSESLMPVAQGIMTTDLYPKVRSARFGGGRIVATAKGAGMIEPNLATMLAYVLTDLDIPRDELRSILGRVVDLTFNSISIDSDTSTSDTVAVVSSQRVPCTDYAGFEEALLQVCRDLAHDVVRNGEGVRHVLRVRVTGAPDFGVARRIGKAIVNAPLFKCAVAGNDPNVGRLMQAIGKHVGAFEPWVDLSRIRASIGGLGIFSGGTFRLDPTKEAALVAHMKAAELYQSKPNAEGVFEAPIHYPPHERCVELDIDLGVPHGRGSATVLGADLTHEYVSENADYRS